MSELRDLLGSPPSQQRVGVTVGVVTGNDDPEGLGRVRVRFPLLPGENESHWVRLVTPMAGADSGLYFLPEVDDEVLVIFEHGRVDSAYVLGGVWNGKDKPPETNKDRRVIRSRSGHTIRLDDSPDGEKLEIIGSSGTEKITIDTATNTITVSADGDLVLESQNGKLILKGKTGVEVTSEAGVKVEAAGNVDLKSDAQVNVKGSAINLN